ncbi:FAD-binding oxidoreductase [Ahrensia kielensis]|uniref:FAD-binding oxidoreductase n=1 Tax=Ahrensia kielensis TaxID=76980 RepID=UPI003CCC6767
MSNQYDSFGGLNNHARHHVSGAVAVRDIESAAADRYLPFGNGRSYGDSCHNDGGVLADMRSQNNIISFDAQSGLLTAEPGVFLHEIIDHCAPHGWFLPVTPGTRFVTLGGAVANDVHGKNHHVRGTFGCHVEALTLVRSDGVHRLTPDDLSGLFQATIGGMGLTGMIARVTLRMMKIASLDVTEKLIPFQTLDEYFAQAEQADADNEYAVAWLDQLSGERGILMTANHADNGNFDTGSHKAKLQVPFKLPFNALNHLSLKAFNTAFYYAKKRKSGQLLTSNYQDFFYPLDAVENWNRLYGPRGLFQHQSAIPADRAVDTIRLMLYASQRAGQASFLTVLKRFGAVNSPGLLSFPQPGYTLTLDFPNRGEKTLALLRELDRLTVQAGGRVNPYKDARMSAQTFAASFPNWEQLEAKRDPKIMSDFWRRTAQKLPKNGNANNSNELVQWTETPSV